MPTVYILLLVAWLEAGGILAGSRLEPNGDLLKLHFRTYLAGSPLLSESYTGGLGWKPGGSQPFLCEVYCEPRAIQPITIDPADRIVCVSAGVE